MSLSKAMFASVSGLGTASAAISVIGDNISNVGTPGFKERRAEFADVLGQAISTAGGFSQTGSGSRISNVSQIFSQGTFETTGRDSDLAIEGRGFFVLDGATGRSYTRTGVFGFDASGTLVNTAGERVQGFGIDPLTLTPNGQLGDITVSNTLAPPQATTRMDLSLNLASSATLVGPFSPTTPGATSNFQAVLDVYDSLGNSHPATVYFTRTAAGAWDWNAVLDAADTTLPPATAGDPVVVQGSGTLSFDASGNLLAAAGSPVTFEFSGGAAAGQSIDIDFGPTGVGNPLARTTQFAANASAINQQSQDGYGAGTLAFTSFDGNGILLGTFTNGVTRPLAQIAMADFAAVEGLDAIGNNAFIETQNSGQPLIGGPGTAQFGSVRSASLEQSNVDLAAQFVKLILNQRAFQANTRTVSTTNELLANLVQLGQ